MIEPFQLIHNAFIFVVQTIDKLFRQQQHWHSSEIETTCNVLSLQSSPFSSYNIARVYVDCFHREWTNRMKWNVEKQC